MAVFWAVRRVDGHHWAETSPGEDTSTFSERKVEEILSVFCAEWFCVLSVVPPLSVFLSNSGICGFPAALENLEECSSSHIDASVRGFQNWSVKYPPLLAWSACFGGL